MARPKASKPFDATSKTLLEADPAAWLALIGCATTAPVRLIDADLATVTTEADKVCRVDGPDPWLAHFEFQASHDLTLPRRLLRYNVLLDARHDLPVHSAVILLRPKADGPELTGLLERRPPVAGGSIRFSYQVVRVWECPVDSLLNGGAWHAPPGPSGRGRHQ